jgi:hypothetical protein
MAPTQQSASSDTVPNAKPFSDLYPAKQLSQLPRRPSPVQVVCGALADGEIRGACAIIPRR